MAPLPSPQRLTPADHRQVVELFQRTSRQHLHLDWRSLHQWLPHPDLCCWVVQQGGVVRSLLGATIHAAQGDSPSVVAWLRMALPAPFSARPALDALWEALYHDLRSAAVERVALLALVPWIEPAAGRWGFERTNAVISMRRTGGTIPLPPSAPLHIRDASNADLDVIALIDAQAFAPLWRYSRETLAVAFSHAVTVTVLEDDERTLGYQLSTRYAGNGHLARLAVVPEAQGRGLGGLLIGEMVRFFEARGVSTITVNTQADNAYSRHLYARLGFKLVDHGVAVWTLDL
jgi:GNAT superfamily N-acetyltransferase